MINQPERIYAQVGSVIQHYRVKKSMTQQEFVDFLLPEVKLVRASLSKLELGKQRIMLHDLVAIANKVGFDFQEFFNFYEAQNEKA